LVWLIAPGSFALVSVLCWFNPDICTDPPNVLFAIFLVTTHAGGGLATIALLLRPGPHRRMFEFWALFAYGAAIAGWFVFGMGSYESYWAFVWAANSTTCVAIVAGLVRLTMLARRRARLAATRQARSQ
jgi:heme exporter protein D